MSLILKELSELRLEPCVYQMFTTTIYRGRNYNYGCSGIKSIKQDNGTVIETRYFVLFDDEGNILVKDHINMCIVPNKNNFNLSDYFSIVNLKEDTSQSVCVAQFKHYGGIIIIDNIIMHKRRNENFIRVTDLDFGFITNVEVRSENPVIYTTLNWHIIRDAHITDNSEECVVIYNRTLRQKTILYDKKLRKINEFGCASVFIDDDYLVCYDIIGNKQYLYNIKRKIYLEVSGDILRLENNTVFIATKNQPIKKYQISFVENESNLVESDLADKQPIVSNECSICFEQYTSEYALVPCGHAKLCSKCADKFKNCSCPVCRESVSHVIKLFR